MTVATYEQYKGMLRVDKLRLDDELELHADVRQRIAEEVARLNTRMLESQDELKRVESRALEDAKDGNTEAVAKGKALRDPDRRRAFAVFQERRETYEMWKELLESWDAKGHKLRDLGSLYIGDYFAIKTVDRTEHRPRREVHPADEGRTEVRRERRSL